MLHPYLRSKTDDQHQQLENTVSGLLSSVTDSPSYCKLLRLMAGYLIPLEEAVMQQPLKELVPDIAERKRSRQLLSDIHIFMPGWQQGTKADIPPIDNPYQALGALYVLEGSSMGGPIIARMIRNQTSLISGLSYFESYGDERKKKWNQFREYLDNPRLYEHKDQIAHTAVLSFQYYKKWLEEAVKFEHATNFDKSL
ncbi:MAG TPA: biliverdin-producing heme oxygenase [Flavihumibacter sp.]|jgi:heme oxygenase